MAYVPTADHFEIVNESRGLVTAACDPQFHGNNHGTKERDMTYRVSYGEPCSGRVNSISTMVASFCACKCHGEEVKRHA